MRLLLPLAILLFIGSTKIYTQNQVLLQELPASFTLPIDIKHAGDERLFIVEKSGIIWIMTKEGEKLDMPFLNITSIVNSGASERGLLGLAFHPDYATNGYFFVNYTGMGGHTRISRFSRSSADPNLADPASELVLMVVTQPFSNHNAGDLAFGPDGYLYVTMGDGGSGGDPQNLSQNPMRLLGKMLRIDVDNGSPYGIPPSNPFATSTDTLPEIWALGLRNPWKVSFDRLTGDFWIADVGQNAWEEINMEPAGSPGGKNWGWRCYEGFAPFNTGGCGPQASYDFPVHVYANQQGVNCSVTGGYVYRGQKHPSLYGKYIYADFCGGGRMWTLEPDPAGGWINTEVRQGFPNGYSAFGEDNDGEMYVATYGQGKIYRIGAPCSLSAEVETTDPLCAGDCDGVAVIHPSGGCPPYTVELTSPDGMTSVVTDTFFAELCPGLYTYLIRDCNDCEFEGEFELAEPSALNLQVAVTAVTCPGDCDGALAVQASGGCAPYEIQVASPLIALGGDTLYQNLCADTYSVQLTDCNGCVRTMTAEIVEPAILSISIFWAGDTLFASTGFAGYIWFLDGVEVDRTTAPYLVPDTNGEYNAIGVDANDCEYVSNTVQVEITSLSLAKLGIQKIFPNPFDRQLTIRLVPDKTLYLTLYDMLGREVAGRMAGDGGNTELMWWLDGISPGVYFLVVRGEDGIFGVERLVKSH